MKLFIYSIIMTNLVTITKESRLILKVGGIFAGLILIIYILVSGGSLMRQIFFPKPPPLPKQEFGKLPHIVFGSQPSSKPAQFTVNTIDGTLPALPDRLDVYKLITPEPNLLALDNAKNTLDSLDFVDNQAKLTDTLYRWTQAKSGIEIQFDIVTRNFTISSNYLTNPFLVATSQLPPEDKIVSDLRGYLQTIDANRDNIDFDATEFEYLENRNGTLTTSENISNARFLKIKIHHKPIQEIPVTYGESENRILTFIASYPSSRFQLLEGNFYNPLVDENNKSDYPLKTIEQAFEDLKSGNAYIFNPQNLTNVDITNIELTYYMDSKIKEYLLPVVVFRGINFEAYVEAISSTSLAN